MEKRGDSEHKEDKDFLYPMPVFVKNTFIDLGPERPVSFDGFYQERQVTSCPVSGTSDPFGSDIEAPPGLTGKRRTYTPGELFMRSVSLESPLGKQSTPGKTSAEEDRGSECSTADTAAGASSLAHTSPTFSAHDRKPSAVLPQPGKVAASTPATPGLVPQVERCAEELPSIGSAAHSLLQCKPCAFVNTKGCASGADCIFCHLCEPGEKKRRQKEKRAFKGAVRQLQRFATEGWAPWSYYGGTATI